MKLSSQFLGLAFASLVALSPFQARSADFTDKYVPVNMQDLVDFLVFNKAHTIDSLGKYSEYLHVSNCNLSGNLKNNQFKLEEMRQKFDEDNKKPQKESRELYFRIPFTVRVASYNFNTQAMDVVPESRLTNVKTMEIIRDPVTLCDGTSTNALRTIPSFYSARLNYPVSLYRIPMQKTISEALFEKLDTDRTHSNQKIIYGNMFLQIDAAEPEADNDDLFKRAVLRGQINAIDLYADQDRKTMIKRLDYTVGF